MNIVEYDALFGETYRVTNVARQYVVVEMLRGGSLVSMKRFEIGDQAEYDSFNLKYTGKIVSIGEKTVTVQEKYQNGRRHRLNTREFAMRNWDFDSLGVAAHNQIAMQNI